ncbi:hypothetical protein KUTeg_025022 [Tegillarca granosa]|uniref:Uncharacterized protein n=1 Tax=Tegillarca granosa TaxID=220873 RepID=A0ABQ9DZ22_TEGGR|nr:hypothetical protein KUTeg_025022 [Tegillarca granosa]
MTASICSNISLNDLEPGNWNRSLEDQKKVTSHEEIKQSLLWTSNIYRKLLDFCEKNIPTYFIPCSEIKTTKSAKIATKTFCEIILMFETGSVYRDKVKTPKAEQILSSDESERQQLEKIPCVTAKPIIDAGNEFWGTSTKVTCYNDIRNFSKIILQNPLNASATHNIITNQTC